MNSNEIENYINNLINKNYNTDKGYKYFYYLIKEKYPNFKINEENLENICFEKISKQEYEEKNLAALYDIKENKIRIFIDNVNDEQALLNSFAHELIHLFTSEITPDGVICEGINERIDETTSPFLGINEGITQMIANEISNYELKDAYSFETNISKELSIILGKEKLLEIYSSRNCGNFMNELCSFNDIIDVQNFVIKTIEFHNAINYGQPVNINTGTIIQKHLMDFYNNSDVYEDKKFKELFMSWDKVLELAPDCGGIPYKPEELAFVGVEDLVFSPNEKRVSL